MQWLNSKTLNFHIPNTWDSEQILNINKFIVNMDIDEKILEKNVKIQTFINGIDYNFNYELDDCRDLEDSLKETALEYLEELEDKLGDVAETLLYTINYFKEEQ